MAKIQNINVLSAVDTSSQNGGAIDSSQLVNVSFQAYFGDSTAVGSIQIQCSNDIPPVNYSSQTFVPSHWTNVPSGSAAVTAGASVVVAIPNASYRWLRAQYIYTSGGTSTVNVNMFATCV